MLNHASEQLQVRHAQTCCTCAKAWGRVRWWRDGGAPSCPLPAAPLDAAPPSLPPPQPLLYWTYTVPILLMALDELPSNVKITFGCEAYQDTDQTVWQTLCFI